MITCRKGRLELASRFVVIVEKSTGNESVGSMWMETKTFGEKATLREVADWALGIGVSGKIILIPDHSAVEEEDA